MAVKFTNIWHGLISTEKKSISTELGVEFLGNLELEFIPI